MARDGVIGQTADLTSRIIAVAHNIDVENEVRKNIVRCR